MIKYLLMLLLLSTFIACDKGHDYANKKRLIITDEMKEEVLQRELEANYMATCEVAEVKKSFFKRLTHSIKSLIIKDKNEFNIVYPEALTTSVMKELKEYIYDKQEFAPEKFWIVIGDDSKKAINTILIKKFVKLTDEQFLQVRNFVAFSFLFYFQETQLKEAKESYEIHLNDTPFLEELKVSKISIAFSYDAKFENRTKISLCEKSDLLMVNFQDDAEFLAPSNITGKVTCEQRKRKGTSKVEFVEINNEKLNVTITTGVGIKKISLAKADLVVNSTNERKASLNYNQDGNELKLEVIRKTKDLSLSKIKSLAAHLSNGTQITLKDFAKCKVEKPLKIE